MTRIVTSTYRYKRPTRKRKAVALEAPAIVTIDPKTRGAKRDRHPLRAAAEFRAVPSRGFGGREATPQSTMPVRQVARDRSVTPKQQLANDDDTGPRRSAIVMAKEGRRLRDERTAAQDTMEKHPPASARTGEQQPNPAPRKSAIVTARDRKTVQRQREQQQMAKLMQDEPKRPAIVTARKPGRAIPDGWLPDTPEEHKRRGDAADALFREMKRRIAVT